MPSFLRRLANVFLGTRTPEISEAADETTRRSRASRGSGDTAFQPIDSNAATRDWFDGMPSARTIPIVIRDSIASDPDSARWFRKPRYVVSGGGAVHRTSNAGK